MSDNKNGHEQEHELTVDVITKYRLAGDVINVAMLKVIDACKAGENVKTITALGDAAITTETGKLFKKKKKTGDDEKAEAVKKGVAFPVCLSVNHVVCHFSPIPSDIDVILNDGDVVKIDMAAHVDGYIAAAAHTLIIGATKDTPASGSKADVVVAAHTTAELAQRLVKVGANNNDITTEFAKIGTEFECVPVEGMLSHQLQKNTIDGKKTIVLSAPKDKAHESETMEVNDVFAMDLFMSSGDGKAKNSETRTTVYKKTEETYLLKMKASRAIFSDIKSKFDMMPFTLRAFDNEKTSRMGIVECSKHGLVTPFPVLEERKGAYVAQFKFTQLLTSNGPIRITKDFHDASCYSTDKTVTSDELKLILAQSTDGKKNKKKKKSEAAAPAKEE